MNNKTVYVLYHHFVVIFENWRQLLLDVPRDFRGNNLDGQKLGGLSHGGHENVPGLVSAPFTAAS